MGLKDNKGSASLVLGFAGGDDAPLDNDMTPRDPNQKSNVEPTEKDYNTSSKLIHQSPEVNEPQGDQKIEESKFEEVELAPIKTAGLGPTE